MLHVRTPDWKDPTHLFPILFLACVDLLISCHAYSFTLESLHWAQILFLLCSFVLPFYFGMFFPWYVLGKSMRPCRSLFWLWSRTSATVTLSSVVPLSFFFFFFVFFLFFFKESKPEAVTLCYYVVIPCREMMRYFRLEGPYFFGTCACGLHYRIIMVISFWKTSWFQSEPEAVWYC